MSAIPNGTNVSMSGHELVFGETIFAETRSSNDIFEDTETLRQRIEEDARKDHARNKLNR